MKCITLTVALAAVLASAASATASRPPAISQHAIAGIRLGMTKARAVALLGGGTTVRQGTFDNPGQPDGWTAVVSAKRKVAVYFEVGLDKAVMVTTWNRSYKTADGAGPCTPVLRLKKLYRAAGLPMESAELPDHLTVMLAFAALAPPGHGEALLAEHRPAIELLRLSLHDLSSPYAHLLDAIAAVLPDLSVTDRGEVARLAREGPPEEAVGLQPYGPPEAMPEEAHA